MSHVDDVTYNMQAKHVDINSKKVNTTSSGLWQSKVCINAASDTRHANNDCSYTMISIPIQVSEKEIVLSSN